LVLLVGKYAIWHLDGSTFFGSPLSHEQLLWPCFFLGRRYPEETVEIGSGRVTSWRIFANWTIVCFGQLLKSFTVAQILELLYSTVHKVNVSILTKFGFGSILGDIFTNSSGQPVCHRNRIGTKMRFSAAIFLYPNHSPTFQMFRFFDAANSFWVLNNKL
jgi:hypothetical protein